MYVPEQVIGIPWPRVGKTEYKGGQDTGQLTPEQEPHHRMLYIHCEGQESTEPNSSSLVNEEQADAAAHVVLCILEQYRWHTSPDILILTPYRAQHNLLTRNFTRCNPNKVRVSTIDAAQGQEADIVIISFVMQQAMQASRMMRTDSTLPSREPKRASS